MAQSTGLPLVFRVHDKESMQRLNTDSNGSDGGCVSFSGKHHGFLVSELREGMQRSDTDPHGSDNGWKNGGRTPNTADASTFNCMRPS
jgi:hypothetical protein